MTAHPLRVRLSFVGFEFLDISGDAGVRAWGSTLDEVFVSAAEGMYSLITDIEGVRGERREDISIKSRSSEGLLVAWLNELIFRFDTYGFIARKMDIESLNDSEITASVWGEEFDPERHERGLLVKAATYHNLKFEKKDGLWQVEVIFDI